MCYLFHIFLSIYCLHNLSNGVKLYSCPSLSMINYEVSAVVMSDALYTITPPLIYLTYQVYIMSSSYIMCTILLSCLYLHMIFHPQSLITISMQETTFHHSHIYLHTPRYISNHCHNQYRIIYCVGFTMTIISVI